MSIKTFQSLCSRLKCPGDLCVTRAVNSNDLGDAPMFSLA